MNKITYSHLLTQEERHTISLWKNQKLVMVRLVSIEQTPDFMGMGASLLSENSIKQITFSAQEIELFFHSEGSWFEKHTISFNREEIDEYGDILTLTFLKKRYEVAKYDSFSVAETETGKMYFNLAVGTNCIFKDIAVYGIEALNYTEDYDDFPEDSTFFNISTEMFLKINTNGQFSMAIFPQHDSLHFSLYGNSRLIDDYIAMTQEVWGRAHGYSFKYKI